MYTSCNMNVELISYTQPNKEFEGVTDLLTLIAYIARVSNPSNQHNNKTARKLVEFLIREGHWSPFEMVDICLQIDTTRDIGRQMLRHRSFFFQEFSQRYADPTKDLTFIIREARLQDNKNRQNSIETEDDLLQRQWQVKQQQVIHENKLAYKWAIENGIAKEVARAVLPEGNTGSRLYMKGTVRSWMHFIEVRSGPETQKEHREIAIECAKVIQPIFPMITDFITE